MTEQSVGMTDEFIGILVEGEFAVPLKIELEEFIGVLVEDEDGLIFRL
jgi:hypothetical protein